MFIEIQVPDIGDNEVEITEVMVKVGEKIEAEQSLITVEGDKASMEIPSPKSGIVKEIKITVGDKVTTGKCIMIFESSDNSEVPRKVAALSSSVFRNAFVEIKEIFLPDIGGNKFEVTDITVKVGDKVVINQVIITIKDNKNLIEVLAPCLGTIKEIKIAIGDKVKAGLCIMTFETPTTSSSVTTPMTTLFSSDRVASQEKVVETKNEYIRNNASVHATPMVRRLAYEFGVNLIEVKGTGRKGRILHEDVKNYVKDVLKHTDFSSSVARVVSPKILPWPQVDYSKFGEFEEIKLGRIQKISGANLSRNWMMIPHVTIMEDIDITDLEEFRKAQNKEAENKNLNVKITSLVFIIKAVARALEDMPRFNASISEDGQRLFMKKYINIGIAVDTPTGLVVPVFKNVNKQGIINLSHELMEFSKKARAGKLTASDMQGGCFTISSLGAIGTTAFTPIINAPEVAIIGLSRSSIKPVWDGSKFLPRLILPISLSFDHRVIDGADSARFITLVSQLINDIRRLIM